VTGDDPLDREARLIEAGLALAAELDLDAILDRIVQLATELTGARYGALGVLGPDRTIERFMTEGVTAEERVAIGDPPTGHGLLGLLIDDAKPIRIDDISSDPRSSGFPPNHPRMRTFLGVPVRALGRVFGNLYLTDKDGGSPFDEDDQRVAEALATQAGVAIENARLVAEMKLAERELRRLELMDERERIAKELHDGVIQSLFGVGMALQGATAMTTDAEMVKRLEGAVDDIDRAIRDLRNYIFGLRPGILADRQLDQAIRDLCFEFEEASQVVTVVEIDPDAAAELSGVASDVIQITREALSNIRRHSGAHTCRVSVGRDGERISIEIDDDGQGFDAAAPGDGMGLRNIRARVQAIGGEVSLSSTLGEGTTVTVSLPGR
jgi:signal transduction histidine kinase